MESAGRLAAEEFFLKTCAERAGEVRSCEARTHEEVRDRDREEEDSGQSWEKGSAMGSEQVVEILRRTIETAFLMGAPLLLVATAVGLVINVVQVVTSLQETTVSTVPRLFAVAAATVLLMPWMVRRIGMFTLQLFSDFRPFLR
jgi:flagellar biosynthesis protein FliQ